SPGDAPATNWCRTLAITLLLPLRHHGGKTVEHGGPGVLRFDVSPAERTHTPRLLLMLLKPLDRAGKLVVAGEPEATLAAPDVPVGDLAGAVHQNRAPGEPRLHNRQREAFIQGGL